MLTGDPRTATVRAIDDVRALEIPAERFREVALERPGLVEHISTRRIDPPRRARSTRAPWRPRRSRRRARHAVREDPEILAAAVVISCQLSVASSKRRPAPPLNCQLDCNSTGVARLPAPPASVAIAAVAIAVVVAGAESVAIDLTILIARSVATVVAASPLRYQLSRRTSYRSPSRAASRPCR